VKYQVAEYTIDTARYRISSGDAAIPAEPKVFDLLVYLIRHRDRVVSREELFREVWDGREVSDATLSNHVKTARKILGDSGELQKTILTIRGRGYQFIAPVAVIAVHSGWMGNVLYRRHG
jgi:DNA-binding winged helix-turn-helix (wHTH) protein